MAPARTRTSMKLYRLLGPTFIFDITMERIHENGAELNSHGAENCASEKKRFEEVRNGWDTALRQLNRRKDVVHGRDIVLK